MLVTIQTKHIISNNNDDDDDENKVPAIKEPISLRVALNNASDYQTNELCQTPNPRPFVC